MCTFGGVDACDTYGYLGSTKSGPGSSQGTSWERTHRLVLQIDLLRGNAAGPTPAGQSSSWGVEHVEVVALTDARDLAEDATLPEETGLDVGRPRYAAQIGAVYLQSNEDRRGHQNCGDPISRVLEVLPIGAVEAVSPGDRAPFGAV